MRCRTRASGDRGAAAVEFAIVLPFVLLLTFLALPVIQRVQEANRLDQAVGAALRHATKASANGTPGDDAGVCPNPRRRQSGAEIRAFLVEQSEGILAQEDVTITITNLSTGAETAHPCRSVPGSTVAIRVDWHTEPGAIGDVANGVASLFGRGPVISASTRQLTAVGVLE